MHIGQRISLHGFRGTIRFYGPLEDSSNTLWYGIEWDDIERGKHSGKYEKRQIFRCRSNSGSFLKASKVKFDSPCDLQQAIRQKYLEPSIGADVENVKVAGISRSIQSIGFDKIRERNRDISQLSQLSLSGRCVSDVDITDEAFRSSLAHLEFIDLSWNLLDDVSSVIRMCQKLPNLKSLNLEGNRFDLERMPMQDCSAQHSLDSLNINSTFLRWEDIQRLCSLQFPALTSLQCARNGLGQVPYLPISETLLELNVKGNQISDLHATLHAFPRVERLDISQNAIHNIATSDSRLASSSLRHINLAENPLATIEDLANLSCYTMLSSLQYTFNLDDGEGFSSQRSRIIALSPHLVYINRSIVTQQERHEAAQTPSSVVAKSNALQADFFNLEMRCGDVSQKKRLLATQTVKQLKTIYAKFAQMRPTQIQSLCYVANGHTTELNDDFAQLAYYDLTDCGFVTNNDP